MAASPFRHSLAVTLYGDTLSDRLPLDPEVEDALASMLAGFVYSGRGARRTTSVRAKSRKKPIRSRK